MRRRKSHLKNVTNIFIKNGDNYRKYIFLEESSDEGKVKKLGYVFTQLGADSVSHWQTLKYLFEHFLR